MSRIGKKPVTLPAGVKAKLEKGQFHAEGPKGKLSFRPHGLVKVAVSDSQVSVSVSDESREARSLHGLTRTLVQNVVNGVSTGFTRELLIQGVGYRAELKGNSLVMALGFSHQVEFQLPAGIKAEVKDRTQVLLSGIDKQLIGQTAAKIRSFRPPEPYGGKGIRYSDEIVKRKEGKTGSK